MSGEAERKLYVAARTGDVLAFQQLLNEDPHLLESVSFSSSNKTPLHIATMHGMSNIVERALVINPRLALDLDSNNSSPLHMAAAQGSLEIAKKLLSVAPEARWWRDSHNMNPVHIAAVKGHVEVLEELLRPDLDFFPAMERVHRGQTVLHLCVKHGQLRALKVLVEKMEELVRAVDDDGETILHLAVRCGQLETVQYLVDTHLDVGTQNSMEETPMDILKQTRRRRNTYYDMKKVLSKYFSTLSNAHKLMDMVMVVMVLVATMAFQAIVSPPGGVWQDGGTEQSPRGAGEAVMASTHPNLYMSFLFFNNTAFVSSIAVIILVVFGRVSVHYRPPVVIVLSFIGLSVLSITFSYGISLLVTARDRGNSLIVLGCVMTALGLALFLLSLCAKTHDSYEFV